jgi:RNA polymerase sigma-70 factor (ECF subfamily)
MFCPEFAGSEHDTRKHSPNTWANLAVTSAPHAGLVNAEPPRHLSRSLCHDQDAILAARAADGDSGAFSEIYVRWAPGIRRYVGRIVANRWDAEDVTQDVFVRLLSRLGRYDAQQAAFSAWTLTVARNAALDHVRRRRSCQPLEELREQPAAESAGAVGAGSLREVLAGMSASQREILLMRALAGFTPPELSVHGSRSRGSVNALYHRARISARRNLIARGVTPSNWGSDG